MQSYPNPTAPTTPHKRARDSPESRSPESPTHPVNKASRTTFSPRALFDGYTPITSPPKLNATTTTTTPRLPSTSASFGLPSASEYPASSSPTARPRTLLCTLPPTCSRRPTSLASSKDLEAHYATHHAHVCEVRACAAVFPDARLLELHQTECHDPIAAVRKDRGEKIFACHLPAPTCGRIFLTPKARRLHLISAHAYPKAYFFAVTNKGIGGLLSKWGDGASMIRGEWKPREGDVNGKNTVGGPGEKMDVDVGPRRGDEEEEDEDDDEDEDEEEEDDDDEEEEDEEDDEEDEDENEMKEDPNRTPRVQAKDHLHPHAYDGRFAPHDDREDADSNELAQEMDALTLVPSSIRFGRGGKSGGLMNRGGGFGYGGGHGGGGGLKGDDKNDGNVTTLQSRGRGVRGRGFARGGHETEVTVQSPEIHIHAGQMFRGRGFRGRGRGDLGWAGGRGRAGIVHIPRGRGRGVPRATSVVIQGRGT